MIILRNPQIAELIEAGCAFKSNVIISNNETNSSFSTFPDLLTDVPNSRFEESIKYFYDLFTARIE